MDGWCGATNDNNKTYFTFYCFIDVLNMIAHFNVVNSLVIYISTIILLQIVYRKFNVV